MTRFYLRVIVLILLTYLLGIFIFLVLIGSLENHFFRPNFATEMKDLGEDLEWRLRDKTADEARDEIAKLQEERRMVFRIEVIETPPKDGGLGPPSSLYFRPKNAPFLLRFEPDIPQFQFLQQQQAIRFLVSLVLSGIFILLAALFVVLPLVRRIRIQEQTISAIAQGDLSARAPEGGDAMGKLGARINQMTRRIKELLAGQQQLIHAVSHEMRTPTARLGFGLEMLLDADTEEERSKRIAAMQDDLGELDGLLEELLSFLRFDQSNDDLSTEELDLHQMLDEIRPKAQPFGPKIDIRTSAIPPNSFIQGNGHHLPRAIENLVRNAVRHADSHVTVRLERTSKQTSIFVDDNGPGIPAADRERIFEPFVRLDSSRDRKTGGTGLGLAIAHRICLRHKGALTAGESPEGGARFTLTLPS